MGDTLFKPQGAWRRMRLLGLLAAALMMGVALGGCLTGPSAPTAADTWAEATGLVLFNGTIWTADDETPWATAVGIVDDRIVAVGDLDEVRAADLGPMPYELDLAGRLVAPGFHDTHNHFLEVGRAYQGDGNPYAPWPPGWDPVAGTIAQQQTAAGHVGTWAGHNQDRVEDGKLPAPPRALHGLEEHLVEDGVAHVDGRLAANDLFFGGPDHVNDDATAADILRMGLATAAQYGLTSTVEAGTSPEAVGVMQRLHDEGDLTLRFNYYIFPEDLERVVAAGNVTGDGDEFVRLLGLKIYSDGWLGPRTAAMRDLYNDRPHQGFAFYTQEEVDDFVLRAHQAGLKLTAHTIGDRATEMLLSAYEKASGEGCAGADHTVCEDPRFSLEHVQLVQPDLMDRMVGLGLVPSIQLSFATSDSAWAEQALGAERLEHAYAWQTMVDRGLVVGGSSDYPIEVIVPLWGIERAVTRVDLNGEPAGGFMPAQALALDTALRMITINAAYLEHRDHELGSITPGKLADLVILDRNLFEIPADEIADTRVALTMVDGRVVFATDAMSVPFSVTTAVPADP